MTADDPTRRFRFAPVLTATVLTVLALWLFKTVAQVFLLLFLAILISLYLGAVANWLERRFRLNNRVAFIAAILLSLSALGLLFGILIQPVINQTQALIQQLPNVVGNWDTGLDRFAARFPALHDVWPPGQHKLLLWIYGQAGTRAEWVAGHIGSGVAAAIDLFAVGVMGIYLGVHPALYREWLIALFPPIHRDLARDLLSELADTLRAYIVAQLLDMGFLGAITALGLYLLGVPFWLPFGMFTGLVAIVPFFGTLLSTTIPALFVLSAAPWRGIDPWAHSLMVIGLGVLVHLIEGNLVSPLIMSKRVDLPPVMTIMAVLVMGELLGGLGLIVALPTLASLMVIVRRILITRIYEGQGFRKTSRERPLILRVPAPGGGVLVPVGVPMDVVSWAEKQRLTT